MTGLSQTLRVLVTGATGKLGGILLSHWRDAPVPGLELVPVSRDGTVGTAWAPGAPCSALGRADAVLALWGVTAGGSDALAANAELAVAAMELAREVGAGRVLHCSSAAVYPPSPEPSDETVTPDPPGAYGTAKLEMERTIAAWQAAHPGGPRASCMRIANVAGADSLFASLGRGDVVTLDRFPDGQGPRRSYVAGADLARACVALLDCPADRLPPVVNICGQTPVAMEGIVRAAGRDLTWRPAPEGAVPEVALSAGFITALGAGPRESDTPEALVSDWRRLR